MRNFRIVRKDNEWTGKDVGHGDRVGQTAFLFDGTTPIAEFSPMISDETIHEIVDVLAREFNPVHHDNGHRRLCNWTVAQGDCNCHEVDY